MPKSYSDLLREARAKVREVTATDVDVLRARTNVAIVDVREDSEWEQGHLPDALHISKSYIEQQIEAAVPDRNQPVVLYCAGGIRSLVAAETLQELGDADVASMSGGFQAWKSGGLPWVAPVNLTAEQKQRYSRHLLIPEGGTDGQKKLLEVSLDPHTWRWASGDYKVTFPFEIRYFWSGQAEDVKRYSRPSVWSSVRYTCWRTGSTAAASCLNVPSPGRIAAADALSPAGLHS